MMNKPNVYVLDTETTGLSESAEIVEIAIIRQEDGKVMFNSLVKPSILIPEEATKIHGITNEMVADAPSWAEIHDQVSSILLHAEAVHIYNSSFDNRLMRQTAAVYGLEIAYQSNCIMKWNSRMNGELYGDDRWESLITLAKRYKFPFEEGSAHRALYDCQMTRFIIPHLIEKQKKCDQLKAREAKKRAYRRSVRSRKMALVPKGVHIVEGRPRMVFDAEGNEYGYNDHWGKEFVTLSKLKLKDLHRAEFAGMCVSTYGDRGYYFRLKEETAGENQ